PTAARLLGARNVHTEPVRADGTLDIAGTVVPIAPALARPGTSVTWSVDPRDVLVATTADGVATAHVLDVIRLGAISELRLKLPGDQELTAIAADHDLCAPGQKCAITIAPGTITVWAAEETVTSALTSRDIHRSGRIRR
ncbi:TOBE domain-containing protein, partial [Nocardia alni]|uniref:TOBE domain-containing protein n=1 Tax=Nocardia alni TaxID=2815723 RepID=UPI001C23FE61